MIPILNSELAKVNTTNKINQHHNRNQPLFKYSQHMSENWHIKSGVLLNNASPPLANNTSPFCNAHKKTSTNSSLSFSSSTSTNSTSTIVNNNLSSIFNNSLNLSAHSKPITNYLTLHQNESNEQQQQQESIGITDNEENAEYFFDENNVLTEYDDKDVISLNVDFSSDCILLEDDGDEKKTSERDDNLNTEKLVEPPPPPLSKSCYIYNEGLYRCEINPKKYTLELSELSSESFTSSSSNSTLPGRGSRKNDGKKFSSSSSSISYYDDFYVSSKAKREKNKLKANRSSTLSMSKNLTYVSSNFDKNLVKSNSTLKRYSLYANELDNFGYEKKRASQINEDFSSDSSSSLSLLVDSSSSSSSSSSLCSIPKLNSTKCTRKVPKKKVNSGNLERSRSFRNEINANTLVSRKINLDNRNKPKDMKKDDIYKCETLKVKNPNCQNVVHKNNEKTPKPKLDEIQINQSCIPHNLNNTVHPVQSKSSHQNHPINIQHQNNSVTYENYLSISRKHQRELLKEQQKHQKTLELNQRTMTAMKQHEYLDAINKNQRTHNTNRSLYMARIHLLDEYLLVKIFSKLNTLEKLNLQFVCKKWHAIIWSNQNTYKLFNRVEIVDKSFRINAFSQTIRGGLKSNNNNNTTTNNLKKPWASHSTLSKLFCRKPNNKNKIVSEIEQANKASMTTVNTDLVLKFLLQKLLNRQTYPLSLCVEYITIKNNNRLTDKGIDLIGKLCPELKYLSLRNCTNIRTNSVCKLITSCENLKYLDLTGCFNVSNIIFVNESLQRCVSGLGCSGDDGLLQQSKNVDFSNTDSKTKAGLKKRFTLYVNFLRQTKNQQAIATDDSNNKTDLPNQSCSIKDLTHISNSSSAITPANYLYLQFVDLSYCSNVNDRCVQNLCKSCPFIRNLYLRKCKLITDISLLHIAKYCLNLRELSLCQCAKLTDNGIRYLGISSSSHAKNANKNDYVNSRFKDSQFQQKSVSKFRIKYLSLAKCPQITDNSLIYLSKTGFFSQIKYLNLRGCTQITDKFIKYFTGGGSKPPMKQRFENNNNDNDDSTLSSEKQLIEIHNHEDNIPFQLKSLDLAKCNITDKTLEYLCRMFALVQSSDSLQRLSLRYCENISDDGIKLLALNCKNLQHLNVTKCNRITANALKQIKSNCKSCIIQHTNFSFF